MRTLASIALAWLLVSEAPVAQAFPPGALLVVEPFAGIRQLTPYGLSGPLVISGPPVTSPSAVAIDATGNAIVTDRYAGTFRYSPSGALLGTVGVAGGDVAVAPSGAIWILDWISGWVFRAPSQGVGNPIPDARGIAVVRGASGQDVVLVTSGENGGQLLRVEAAGPPTVLASGLGAIGQPTVDRFGNVLVPRDGLVYVLDPETGATRGSFASGAFFAPGDVATSSLDRYFVSDVDSGGTCFIREIDPIAGGVTDSNFDTACGGFPKSFAVVPGGMPVPKLAAGDIVLSDSGAFGGAGGVFRIDPFWGTARALRLGSTPIASTLSAGPTHELIAAGFSGSYPNHITGVHRIDPATGTAKLLMTGSGWDSRGSAFDRNGDVFMTDIDDGGESGRLLRYERATGNTSTHATVNSATFGAAYDVEPWGLAIPYRAGPSSGWYRRALLGTYSYEYPGPHLWIHDLTLAGPPDFFSLFVYVQNDTIAFSPNADRFYYLYNNQIRRFLSSGAHVFAQGWMLTVIEGLDVESSGDVVVVDSAAFGGGGGVIRLSGADGFQNRLTPQTFVDPMGIAVVPPPSCSDGVDSDDDGLIDFPADTGCASAADPWETTDCADGIDNDLDGTVDYAASGGDPGCNSIFFGIEDAECSNGADDDGDGRIDAADAQCSGPADNREAATSCGLLGIEVVLVAAWATSRRARRRH